MKERKFRIKKEIGLIHDGCLGYMISFPAKKVHCDNPEGSGWGSLSMLTLAEKMPDYFEEIIEVDNSKTIQALKDSIGHGGGHKGMPGETGRWEMKYKLLKDTYIAKAGTVYVGDDNQRDTYYYPEGLAHTLRFTYHAVPHNLILKTDWFEPVDERWKPKCGEKYYWVSNSGGIFCAFYDDNPIDKARYESGNCFEIREQAEIAEKRIKQTFLYYHKELADKT